MATVEVKPQGSKWVVEKNGGTVSTHRLKRRAKHSAKSESSSGDTLVIRRDNGTIQERRTVR